MLMNSQLERNRLKTTGIEVVYMVFEKNQRVYLIVIDEVKAFVVDDVVGDQLVLTQANNKSNRVVVPSRYNVYHRQEKAFQALALLMAVRETWNTDDVMHDNDIREAAQFVALRESHSAAVLDIIDDICGGIGKSPITLDRQSFIDVCSLSGIASHWGVLNLGKVKIVVSDSKPGIYYPVTRDGCGCESFFYRMKKHGGRCKHMRKHFPIEGEQ